MCVIKIMGNIDVTIEGQSFGLTCSFEEHFNCSNEEGSYSIYIQDGQFGVCGPDTSYCPLNKANPGIQYKEVFCDPCKPRCTSGDEPQELKYGGNQKWLFTTYVNGAPSPIAIEVYSFELTKRKDKYGNDIISIADQECCCNKSGVVLDDFKVVFVPEKQIDIKEMVKASQQLSISGGSDPNTVCDCGCPDGESCGVRITGCNGIGEILDYWKVAESQRCVIA